jgi:hypothetical protein
MSEIAVGVISDTHGLVRPEAVDALAAGFAAVVFGHSHVPSIETRAGVLFLNPGSAGPRRFKLPVTVARVSVSGERLRPQIVALQVSSGSADRYPRRAACQTPAQAPLVPWPRHVPVPVFGERRPWPAADWPPPATLTQTLPSGETWPWKLAGPAVSLMTLPLLICTPKRYSGSQLPLCVMITTPQLPSNAVRPSAALSTGGATAPRLTGGGTL